jgi:uncharacterized repeat protein (TIGR01451 family)/gliding motility-associated-like protein
MKKGLEMRYSVYLLNTFLCNYLPLPNKKLKIILEFSAMGKKINVTAFRMLLFVLLTMNITFSFGQVCSTPGIDGPTTSTPPINTYYPANGDITLSSGGTSVSLGAVPLVDPFGNSYGTVIINPGDLLLIIQVQGADFNTTGNNTYGGGVTNSGPDGLGGTGYSSLNNVGYYEYLVALNSVPIFGGVLQFRGAGTGNGLVKTYYNQEATSTQGQKRFQVVRVPQFSTLTLTNNLSCPAWNGRVGGIIALDAAGAIHMNGFTIDASGAGFRAGYQNREDSGENLNIYRTTTSSRASGKGEGVAGTPRWMFDGQNQVDQGVTWIGFPQGDYGRGAPGNAGGGGNDHNAGGGGGGNGGAGGVGGDGWSGAGGAAPPNGGRPGINMPLNLDRIYLGGGGGGGDANNALSGVKGGPGGGAIFVTADLITGSGTFIANGDDGQVGVYGSAPDGAGGGGAGGSIFIKTKSNSPSANLILIANGGKGGNTEKDDNITHLWHGPGGGGGGGTIFYSIPGATVTTQTNSGKHGITNGGAGIAHGSVDGQAGSASSFLISNLPTYLQGFSASCLPELVVKKQRLNSNPVSGGGVANYQITVENIGGGAAGGTQLRDQLPTGFSMQSATVSYTGNASGPSLLNNIGTSTQPVFEAFNIPFNGKVTINMVVTIPTSTASGTYHNGAQAHFLDPTRNSSDPSRFITASLSALPGSNTTYQSSGSLVTGSNYSGAPNGPSTEDVIVNAFIDAVNDDFSGAPVNGYTGGIAVANVLSNDVFRNIQANLTDVKISVVTPASHPGIVLNTLTGAVNVAPLTPGGTYTIVYSICENGNLTNCDQATITVVVIPTANISITKTDNADPIVAGQNITYTISISNSGPSSAVSVTTADILPSELTFISASSTRGSFSYPNWNLDSLKVNQNETLTIIARVNSNVLHGSLISNTATVSSSTLDPVLTNNSATQTTVVNSVSDLSVVKTAIPNPAIAGEDLTYTITISNNGPSDAQNVSIADNLPVELSFVSASASYGSWSSPTWTIGILAANTSQTLTIVANVDASILQSSVISNTATISSTTTDPVPGNNTDTYNVDVNALADLSISKVASNIPAFAGQTETYTITVTNAGPSYAQSVLVSDIVPLLLLNAEFSTDGGYTWDLWTDFLSHGSLVDGESFNFQLRGKVNATTPTGTVLSNTASVSSTTSDPNTANNSDTETVNVSAQSDLSIEKTGPATIIAGTRITYGLTVINHGPSNAANVVIADAVPAGITNAEYSLNNGNSWGIWNGTRNLPDFEAIPGINNILIRGDLSVGATGTITNTATVSSTTPDPDLSDNSATVNTLVAAQADLILSKSTLTSPVNKNQPIEYLISVFNSGPSNAPNVVITDVISASIISGQQFSTDNGLTWNAWSGSLNIGTLLHPSTFNLRIKGTVTNAATDPISNTASVTSDAVDPNLANNTQTIQTPLAVEADLSIVKTGPATITAGTTIAYSIVATNNSPNMNALEVVITDNVDIDLIPLPEYSTDGGLTWNAWSGSLNIGTLNFGASYSILLKGKVLSSVKVNIPNTAHVSSNTPDPDPANNSSSITSAITRSADISLVKVLVTEPQNLVAGQPIEYLITYHNEGPSDATNYLITDAVPSVITDVEASRCASAYITWPGTFNAQTVVSGGTCTIRIRGLLRSDFTGSITNTATVVSDLTDPNMANNTSTITNAANTQADLFITKTAVPEPVVAGENITYTITVTNLGLSDALAVSVADNLPSELTLISATPGVGTWTSPNWNIGTLTNGSVAAMTLVARLNTSVAQGNIISNTATVTSTTPDPVPVNNTATQTTSVNASADLSITKTDDADPVIAGQNITYTITVTNNGSSDAVNVSVADVLPSELTLVSATPSSGSWAAPNWSIGTLNAGASRSMVIVAKVNTNVTQGTVISNTATVTSTTADPVSANNSDTETTAVNAFADLAISKSALSASVIAGENVTYTLNITNNGPSDAVNVVVSDNLPSELKFISAETNIGSWSSSTWDVGTLAADASASITIIARVNTNVPLGTSVINTATVSSLTADLILGNNSSTHVSSVSTSANLSILKLEDVDPAVAGENITYTISVTNNGPSDALDVNVSDNLPSSLTFVSAIPETGSWVTPNWNIGTLEVGETTSMEITAKVKSTIIQGTNISNTAIVSSSTNDPVLTDNSSTATTAVMTSADLAVVKTAIPNPVIAGEYLTYTITISNNGPSDALNVSLVDNLPPELSFVTASATKGTWSTPNWTIGTLAANTSQTLTIEANIYSSVLQSSIISNTVTLSSTTTDPVPGNNTYTHNADVNAIADLSISKVASNNPAFAGQTETYTITVTNAGPSYAQSVLVSDIVPLLLLNAEFSTDGGYTWDLWTDFLSHGSLVDGESFNFQLRGKVNATTPTGTVLSNTASVSSTTSDPNTANNSDTETVNVSAQSDLSIEKTGPATIIAGTRITYGLTVINHGPSNAANVVIADAVPAGITNAEYSLNNGNSWGIWNGTRNLPDFEAIPGINNILIRGDLSVGATGTITNTATVSSTTPDPDLSDNSATVNTLVAAQADLILSKSTLTSPVNKNQPIEYLISVFNSGPSNAPNVVITDVISASIISGQQFSTDNGLTWNAWSGSLNIGTLLHPSTFNLRIKGTVTNAATDPISNTASVTSDAVDPNLANNTQTIQTPLAVEADLSIVKTGPATITAGTTIAYSIVATNNSPNMNALEVVITDNVDIDLIPLPEYSTDGGLTWNAWSGSLNIGTLNFGASYSILLKGKVLSSVKVNIPNTAHVSSNTPDPDPANNSSSITSAITRSADISLVKVLVTEPQNLVAGQPIEYLITYHNEGPSDATNYLITDAVPSVITDVEASRCASAYITWPGTFNAQTVVSGGTCTIRIRGLLRSDFTGSITNTATVVSDLTDPNMANNTSTITNAANTQADLFITKTAVPEPVVAGENITYTITVTNLGLSDALAVSVADNLPSELTLISATPGVGTWTSPNWNIGTLTNGSVAAMTLVARLNTSVAQGNIISNTATVTSTTPDPVPVNNTATQTTSVNASADLSITKTDDADPVIAGQNITYTITVTNNGSSDAVNVSVADVLPSELTLVSATPSSGSWAAPNWSIGTLNAGASRSMVIVAKVNTNVTQGTVISNTATVTSTTADPVTTNNSDTETVDVVSFSNLSITKTASSSTVFAGSNVTYFINISNNGPSNVSDLTITDALPAGLTYLNSSGGGTFIGGTIIWNLAELANRNSHQFTLLARVNSNLSAGTIIGNSATVNSEEIEIPVISDTIDIVVDTDVNLYIEKSVESSRVNAGENLIYHINIANNGPSIARNVFVTDLIPAGTSFVSALGNGLLTGNRVIWNFPILEVGESRYLTMTVKVNSDIPRGTIIRNVAVTYSDDLPDSIESNTVDVVVSALSDLSIIKTGRPKPVNAGDIITYQINIRNNGPSDAQNVVVEDLLPMHLSIISLNTSKGVWAFPKLNISKIALDEEVVATIVAKVDASTPEGSIIINTATVSSSTTDPDIIDNIAVDSTTVTTLSDLSIVKSTTAGVVAGSEVTYTISVSNNGPSDAQGVTVSDAVSASISNPQYSLDGGTTWNIWNGSLLVGTLMNGSVFTLRLKGIVSPDLTGTLSNTASVNSDTDDPNYNNNSDTEVTPLVVQANVSINKSGPVNVVAGQSILYRFTLSPGISDALEVYVTDVVPSEISNAEYSFDLGLSWVAWPTDNKIYIGTLRAGNPFNFLLRGIVNPTVTGVITNTAIVESQSYDSDLTNNTDTEITPVIEISDLSIEKTNGQEVFVPGLPVEYTITVRNNGPSNVLGVRIIDNAPVGTIFSGWRATGSDGAEFVISGSGNINQVVSLPNSGSIVYKVIVDVPASFNGALVNTATVVVPGNVIDVNGENNSATDRDDLNTNSNLIVEKTADLAKVLAGENVTYSIKITNNGPSDAYNVFINDSIPLGLTFVDATDGGVFANRKVSWTLPTLPSGSAFQVGLVLNVKTDVPDGNIIRNIAFAGIKNSDDRAESDSVDIEVEKYSVLSIIKTASSQIVKAGETVSYSIRIHNEGPSNAANILVTDTLPGGVTFVSATNGGSIVNGIVKWTEPSMLSGSERTYNLVVRVDSHIAEGTVIRNVAVIVTDNPDGPIKSDPEDILVDSESNLFIQKSAPQSVPSGDNITYLIVVKNNGPGGATNVVVSDTIPKGLTFIRATDGGAFSGGVVLWNLAALNVDSTKTLSLFLKVDENLNNGTILSNIAWVTEDNTVEPVESNEVTTRVTTIINPISIVANDDDGIPIVGNNGGVVVHNILENDFYGTLIADTSFVSISLISTSSPNVTLDIITGEVNVNSGTPAGTYEIVYRICHRINQQVCDEATITITVLAPAIEPNDDMGVPVYHTEGGVAIEDVTSNDILNGLPVDLADVILTIVNSPPGQGVELNTITGVVTVAPGTPVGKYEIMYRICDRYNPDNCNEALITVSVIEKESEECILFVPNGFSPNGDGIHDAFLIKCIENYPDASIEIFNRWGNLVFKKAHYGNVDFWGTTDAWWNGYSTHNWNIGNEKLPPGTYFYILNLNKGTEVPRAGSVFLNW